ncbi:MAG: hypothetical protein ACXW3R_16120 [Rhodoplanes sp.]
MFPDRETDPSPRQAVSPAQVVGHEDGRRRAQVVSQPFKDGADFGAVLAREVEAALPSLGGEPHQVLGDDIAGMLQVGRKREDCR